MTFNPSAGQWDNVPANPNRPTNITWHPDHPTSGYDTSWTGKTIGYARGVMNHDAGHPMPVHANPGPWAYTSDVASGINDLRQYLGYPAGTQLDATSLLCLDVVVWVAGMRAAGMTDAEIAAFAAAANS